MALVPGARLGVYEVTAQIGEGGMGQVFRARDTKLHRDVALKVLPDSFAHDAERLARFTREAHTLAALNHPNIATIYGIEDSAGVTALAMEFVEGEDLSVIIARHRHSAPAAAAPSESASRGAAARGGGPPALGGAELRRATPKLRGGEAPRGLSIDDSLPIAKQIADALEAAHEQGIVHRDLKPANIKVRPDGTVKVLDFGLAKALSPDPSGAPPGLSMAPTITSPATKAGVILGTAAYMSPEQARGRSVDRRADIWAFGAVLFEMLTGTRAFPGEDITDTLAAVVRAEPDWNLVPRDVPPMLLVFLRRCLQKDPKQRIGDIHDVRLALEGAFDVAVPPAASASPPPSGATRLPWFVAAAAVVGLAVLAVVHFRELPVMAPPETRVEITTPPGRLSFFKLSPDGRKIVFAAAVDGKPAQLWLRSLDSETAQPLAGTEGAGFPFWSPDSRSIGFHASGKLMRSDLAGGNPRALADALGATGAAWGPDGTIVFSPTNTGPLFRVPAAGGQAVEVTHLRSPADASHRLPSFLPDGRHFLFFVAGTSAAQGVYLGSLDTKDIRLLLDSDSAAVFAPPHHVLFSRQQSLLAQRLDLETLAVSGEAFPVADQVSGDQGTLGEIAVSASSTGSIAYRAPSTAPHQLTWFDRAGRQTGTLGDVQMSLEGRSLRISPDGRTVAATRDIKGNVDVWLIETTRGVLRRFTTDPASDGAAAWAPDNKSLVFYSRRSGPQNLWRKRLDGGTEERLRESDGNEVPSDWSSDGRFVLFRAPVSGGSSAVELWALPLEGDRKPVAVAKTGTTGQTRFGWDWARFSPDGRRVAYQSDETGRNEVFVIPFPGPGVPTQVSTTGGMNPKWRADGREIVYLGPGDRLTAVPVMPNPDGTVEAGTPRVLFTMSPGAAYDITRDGQRILVDTPVGQATTPPITLILNWRPKV